MQHSVILLYYHLLQLKSLVDLEGVTFLLQQKNIFNITTNVKKSFHEWLVKIKNIRNLNY